MLKLTRLNRHIVAINPDQILWVEASPDTTLCLVGGEKLLVRETVDELIAEFIELKRRIHSEPYFVGPNVDEPRPIVTVTRSVPPIPSLRADPVRRDSAPPVSRRDSAPPGSRAVPSRDGFSVGPYSRDAILSTDEEGSR